MSLQNLANFRLITSIEELLEADNDDVTRVFNDMTKTSLMCICREIPSQVRSQKNLVKSLDSVESTIQRAVGNTLKEELAPLKNVPPRLAKEETEKSTQRVERPTATSKADLGIRVRGIPEPQGEDMPEKLESDKNSVLSLLNHLDVKAKLKDVRRVGKFVENKHRPIIFYVENSWDKRLILASLSKLKTYDSSKKLSVSQELTENELKAEKIALKKRYDLIQAGVSKSELRIKNLLLYKKEKKEDGDVWIPV